MAKERSRDIKYVLAHLINVKMALHAKLLEINAHIVHQLQKVKIGEELYKIHGSYTDTEKQKVKNPVGQI